MKLESKTTRSLGLRNKRDKSHGFTNGLTNGFTNGLTNGLTNGKQPKLGRKIKEKANHGKLLAVFVLAVLVLSVVAVLTWQSSSTDTIKIDGRFDDWQGVEKTSRARDATVPENIDIAEYATAETGRNVAFYAKVYGNLLDGEGRYIVEAPSENPVYVANQRETAIPNANGRDVAYVFVDTDNNPATGFKPSQNFAVGADRAIEIIGKNGKIEASRVLAFAGVVQQEWAWTIGESVAAATNGKQLETMAGKSLLGAGERYAVYFYMIDWQNKECRVENALRCENARHTLFGLYLSAKTEVQSGVADMQPKGTPHSPIHINGNVDFANQAASEGWPGDGSPGNPYIIEGYDIDGGGGTYCIWIENTDVHFVVRGCNVSNAMSSDTPPYGGGIALMNVQNGIIANNTPSNNKNGISLHFSSNNKIADNNASNNLNTGILLYYSNANITRNKAAGNSWYGIYLYRSNNNNITENNASKNGHTGILSDTSSNNEITSNNISENPYFGISLSYSHNNRMTNNSASRNGHHGLYLYSSSGNIITENNASGNSKDGIFVEYSSDNNKIIGNSALNNSLEGISLESANNNEIIGNSVAGNNGNGIYLDSSTYNNITNNNVINNNYGIVLYFSDINNLTGNNASGNNYEGIRLASSDSVNINDNILMGNGWYGIYLGDSNNNNVVYNWLCNNTKYGIYITSTSAGNSIHHNNFTGNNGAGRGVNGNCQAYDDTGGNSWYDNGAREGNYWSNWDGLDNGTASAYPLDGGAGASDWYPLANPVTEVSGIPVFMVMLGCISALASIRRLKEN
ncbi:MAG: right-handed parallel beta-helix repeat-containing protein [Thermoplasmata archaeon]|nr:right-handed parallel beta-helix repeat-containing protein [Thermoplasmata archaeon]